MEGEKIVVDDVDEKQRAMSKNQIQAFSARCVSDSNKSGILHRSVNCRKIL